MPPTSPRRWIAFFALLAVLVGTAVTLPILYNLGLQLRPEQLDAARQAWREQGPADYDLTFTVTYDRERLGERHIVLVRGGKVVFASCEGEVLAMAPALGAGVGAPLGGVNTGEARDVPALFDHVEALLKKEGVARWRNFLVVNFDRREGYPRRIIWRVRRSSTREEWDVRLWKPGGLAQLAKGRGR
jgi:hypothetical protein